MGNYYTRINVYLFLNQTIKLLDKRRYNKFDIGIALSDSMIQYIKNNSTINLEGHHN